MWKPFYISLHVEPQHFIKNNKIKTVQILNKRKSIVQGTRQREKTMTGARRGFKIIYENILGKFGLLLSKERIFDKNNHSHQS